MSSIWSQEDDDLLVKNYSQFENRWATMKKQVFDGTKSVMDIKQRTVILGLAPFEESARRRAEAPKSPMRSSPRLKKEQKQLTIESPLKSAKTAASPRRRPKVAATPKTATPSRRAASSAKIVSNFVPIEGKNSMSLKGKEVAVEVPVTPGRKAAVDRKVVTKMTAKFSKEETESDEDDSVDEEINNAKVAAPIEAPLTGRHGASRLRNVVTFSSDDENETDEFFPNSPSMHARKAKVSTPSKDDGNDDEVENEEPKPSSPSPSKTVLGKREDYGIIVDENSPVPREKRARLESSPALKPLVPRPRGTPRRIHNNGALTPRRALKKRSATANVGTWDDDEVADLYTTTTENSGQGQDLPRGWLTNIVERIGQKFGVFNS